MGRQKIKSWECYTHTLEHHRKGSTLGSRNRQRWLLNSELSSKERMIPEGERKDQVKSLIKKNKQNQNKSLLLHSADQFFCFAKQADLLLELYHFTIVFLFKLVFQFRAGSETHWYVCLVPETTLDTTSHNKHNYYLQKRNLGGKTFLQ